MGYSTSLYLSASHVVVHFVKKYPQYKIVNLDKLDYCSSLLNLREIEGAPNYKFVKVFNHHSSVPIALLTLFLTGKHLLVGFHKLHFEE